MATTLDADRTIPFEIRERPTVRLPYQRKPGDPVIRPLRILTMNPAVSRLLSATAVLDVPFEPLTPGPVGAMFEVVDESLAGDVVHTPVDLDDPRVLMTNGLEPSLMDPRFHQQMLYAVCSVTYHAFCTALGRTVTWNIWQEDEPRRLRLRPHAFEGSDAYYDCATGELCFGYYRADSPGGRPGQWIFTCLSHDLIVHEMTHAIVDGLHPFLLSPSSAELLAFHEAFADLIALFQRLSYTDFTRARMARSRQLDAGALDPATWILAGVSPARALGVSPAARDSRPRQYFDPSLPIAEIGAMLVATVIEAYSEVFARKVQRYVALSTGGTGVFQPGAVPDALLDICALQASKLAVQFQAMCIRALDYCPPVDLELGDFLRAVITADTAVMPVDRWGYRESWIESFRSHGIYPSGISHLDERGLLWQSPQTTEPIRDISFRSTRFSGEPGKPFDPAESRRQAAALGDALRDGGLRHELGVVGPADALPEGQLSPPSVTSVRTAARVGPDGQLVLEGVAEVIQGRTVRRDGKSFHFRGGATIVLDVDGNLRYAIRKHVSADERLRRQFAYASSMAANGGADDGSEPEFFLVGERSLIPQPDLLRRLHKHLSRQERAEMAEAPPNETRPKPQMAAAGSAPLEPPRATASNKFADLFAPGHQQEPAPEPQRATIFVSYSHLDAKWLERLQNSIKPLTRDASLRLWSDKQIAAGEKWREQIQRALAESTAALLLVSDNFVASDFIVQDELPPLLRSAEEGGILLLCIAISDGLYDRLGISERQWLNNPKRPLSQLRAPDWRRELVAIARKIDERVLKAR